MTTRDITTKLVHAGERRPLPDAVPVSTPIYASATFTYETMQEIDQVFAGEMFMAQRQVYLTTFSLTLA
jgi:O-acetylhomoserine/O-acetylserine sulfhydrylase-like pyridoxal-dependent enzyme